MKKIAKMNPKFKLTYSTIIKNNEQDVAVFWSCTIILVKTLQNKPPYSVSFDYFQMYIRCQ